MTYAVFSVGFVLLTTVVSFYTRIWVLTAAPVGFLLGFFLEKADLCGASAFSEVVLSKDWGKLRGIWVVIVVSMLGFALLSGLGLVKLNPKPLIWANMALGGLVFGVGMVLAGGCVVGNIMSGYALMSVGNLLFGAVVLLANWATTYFYLMGGRVIIGQRE
jgi:uncharacterized membrane protein YedE/YeeE